MIGSFLKNSSNQVCFVVFENAETLQEMRLVHGNVCIILDENSNQEMITEEIHETIHAPLSQQQNILIVHMSNDAKPIKEYNVPITN